nr:protein kinase-like domain, concanavalin A-like lectin/glucanase domain protein [Tanacetum cinerariifolium]
MEARIATKHPSQVNKIAYLCEFCGGPQDTRYCMENLEQALVDYESSRNNGIRVLGIEKKEEDDPKTSKIKEKEESCDTKRMTMIVILKICHTILELIQKMKKNGWNPNNLKVPCMIGRNMSYVMDFTILENVEANIDPSLSQVIFGRPFVETTKLILDEEQGLITFTYGIREVTFKTPNKDLEMDDLNCEGHDLLLSKVILSDDDVRSGCERA